MLKKRKKSLNVDSIRWTTLYYHHCYHQLHTVEFELLVAGVMSEVSMLVKGRCSAYVQ